MEIINCNAFNRVVVQVQKGDTLQSLANRYSADVYNIVRNNSNIELYEGEIIKIIRDSKRTHVVKPMQTLEDVAGIYSTTTDRLIDINKLQSKRLFVGQILQVY